MTRDKDDTLIKKSSGPLVLPVGPKTRVLRDKIALDKGQRRHNKEEQRALDPSSLAKHQGPERYNYTLTRDKDDIIIRNSIGPLVRLVWPNTRVLRYLNTLDKRQKRHHIKEEQQAFGTSSLSKHQGPDRYNYALKTDKDDTIIKNISGPLVRPVCPNTRVLRDIITLDKRRRRQNNKSVEKLQHTGQFPVAVLIKLVGHICSKANSNYFSSLNRETLILPE